jgi:hypothetical protein
MDKFSDNFTIFGQFWQTMKLELFICRVLFNKTIWHGDCTNIVCNTLAKSQEETINISQGGIKK